MPANTFIPRLWQQQHHFLDKAKSPKDATSSSPPPPFFFPEFQILLNSFRTSAPQNHLGDRHVNLSERTVGAEHAKGDRVPTRVDIAAVELVAADLRTTPVQGTDAVRRDVQVERTRCARPGVLPAAGRHVAVPFGADDHVVEFLRVDLPVLVVVLVEFAPIAG